MQQEIAVRTEVQIPLAPGVQTTFYSFHGFPREAEHIGIRFGNPGPTPLVRVHSECLTGDLFGSLRCDCGRQLQEATERLMREGGLLLYLRQEGRGIGLYRKLEAYKLQDAGFDTYEANRLLNLPEDGRNFQCAAQMLRALGIERVRLLSNNPDKSDALRQHGIDVVDMINTGVYANKHNLAYLTAKREQHHHALRVTEFLRAELLAG